MIYLINNFAVYAIKYVIMLAVITGGCFLGANLAKSKSKKTM